MVDVRVRSPNPWLTGADDAGYAVDETELIHWGRCPECAAATSVS
jgi:Fur family ferric uptake transcriptional regulator